MSATIHKFPRMPRKDTAEDKIIAAGEMLESIRQLSIEEFLAVDLALEETGEKIQPYEAILRIGLGFIEIADALDRYLSAKEAEKDGAA